MARFENIMKSLCSRSFKQPRPVRPFEMPDVIASFTRRAEHIALLKSLVASIEASTPSTMLSTLPPPTPRALPLLPVPRTRPTKANIMVKHRPLPPLPPPNRRFRRALWEVSPDPSDLPQPFPKNVIALPSIPQFDEPDNAAVTLRSLPPSSTMVVATTQIVGVTGPSCPEPNNTNETTQPRCHAIATTTGTQNHSL